MLLRAITHGGLSVLAGALLALTPASAEAAGHGGGHGGGGFHGGGHFGGFHGGHFGGYHGFAGYHGAIHHGGYYGHPYAHYHYNHFRGGYGGFYPYLGAYGFYPDYGNYGYYNSYYDGSYDPYPYAQTATTGGSDWDDVYNAVPPPDANAPVPIAGSAPSPVAPAADERAHLTVTVPAGAQLWVDDSPTTSTGPVRQFASPPLKPGVSYTYTVHARWDDNGRAVDQTRDVEVTAGASVNVRFPASVGTAAQTTVAPHG